MTRKAIIIFLLMTTLYWVACQFDWHLNRNAHNILPAGNLIQIGTNTYLDENGLVWELQPHLMNAFHQPEETIEPIGNAYPIMDNPPKLDIENSNLKLLQITDDGASHEAILQPDGTYLTTGPKMATYNYEHPAGIWGMTKHAILDVFPHFANSNYK